MLKNNLVKIHRKQTSPNEMVSFKKERTIVSSFLFKNLHNVRNLGLDLDSISLLGSLVISNLITSDINQKIFQGETIWHSPLYSTKYFISVTDRINR